jgi:hypothetical protein
LASQASNLPTTNSQDSTTITPAVSVVEANVTPTVAPVIAIMQSANTKTTPKLSSLSAILSKISAAPEEKTVENEVVVVETKSPIVFEELQRYWNEFVEIKRQGKEMNHFTVCANRKLVLLDNLTITFEVNTEFQLDTLKEFRGDLLEYLRKKLNNSALQLEATITQTETKALLYTNQDKYNYLATHYPILEDFRRRLGLELH